MKQRRIFFLVGVIGIASWGGTNSQAAPRLQLLAQAREQLKAPAYTAEEKTLVATQAHFFLDQLFVHRDLKIADFGADYDPVPRLDELRRKAAMMPADALNEHLLSAFIDLHDLHTNFIAPKPLACATSFIPVEFVGVSDADDALVVISGKSPSAKELTQNLEIGMQLKTIDGRPIESVLADLGKISGGANPAAMRMRAIQMVSLLSHATHSLPETNQRRFEFARPDGQTVTATLPWIVYWDEACLKKDKQRSAMPFSQALTMGVDDYQRRYTKVFTQPELTGEPVPGGSDRQAQTELNDVFTVQTITTPAGRLGYIKLKGFYWDDDKLDLGTVVEAFRRTVEADLNETKALVIDVRGNPGGVIVMAEKLVQLFAPGGVEPSTARMLANELNAEIFRRANDGDNRWTAAIEAALRSQQRYTGPLAITPASEANAIGQIWFRPVVVLTDAACYSACDIFTAGMQDNNAATILGIHAATGAGGANVMDYETFQAIFQNRQDSPFPDLPHGQSMRVAWRQTVRVGQASGQLLEDAGVTPDVVVPLQLTDIGGESRALMRQIHQHIDRLMPRYTSSLGFRRGGIVNLENGSSARWHEEVTGIDLLEVYHGEELAARIAIPLSATPASLAISLPQTKASWQDHRITLVGYAQGKRVLRAVRELRWRGPYTAIPAQGIKLDFDDDSNASILHTVQLRGPADSGWQNIDGQMQIGSEQRYPGGVLARAFLPLKLDGQGGKMRFDLKLDAEDLHDSLRIYAIDPDTGERFEYYSGSQLPLIEGIALDLPRRVDRLDLVFEFESDENWQLTGPRLDNLQLVPAEL